MRRYGSARSDAFVASSDGEQGFWPSYADMMSAVALILFFLMLISYIQNLITGNDLKKTQDQLQNTMSQLEITLQDVADAQTELVSVTSDLDSAKLTLSSQADEIAKQAAEIAAQQLLVEQQKQYVSQAESELSSMRSQMETIAGLRVSILEQIRDRMAEVMGDSSKVSIGSNGNIILSDSVLFDIGSSEIKPQSKPLLDQLIAVFSEFLSDSENAKYVESVIISGHTDSTGLEDENRVLSTDRANSVLNYLLTQQSGRLYPYKGMFCAAGYGATRPVQDNGTEFGRAANRRIEISMILKDDTVMDIINNYLNVKLPETQSAAPEGITVVPNS